MAVVGIPGIRAASCGNAETEVVRPPRPEMQTRADRSDRMARRPGHPAPAPPDVPGPPSRSPAISGVIAGDPGAIRLEGGAGQERG